MPVSFVPKRDSAKVHLIHNLSHPFHGNSVNVLVSVEDATVQYQKFDDFLSMVRAAGPAAELGKIGLTDGCKHVLVNPDFWHMLGIHVGDGTDREFYIETTLPFGHRLAPKIFSTFSDPVWVAREFGAGLLFRFVDDFVAAQPAGSGLCQVDLDTIHAACGLAGFKIQEVHLHVYQCWGLRWTPSPGETRIGEKMLQALYMDLLALAY